MYNTYGISSGVGDVMDYYNRANKGQVSSVKAPSPVNIALDVPLSDIGIPIPFVIGKRIVSQPNVLWYGNLKPQYTTDSVVTETTDRIWASDGAYLAETGLTTYTTVDTTYISGYNMDIQVGICLGPDVKLRKILYNNEVIWSGTVGPARASITLPENDTPISGSTLIFRGGAFDQTVDPLLTDPDVPGYVGLAYIIITDVRADKPLNNLQFEVERAPNPLGLSASNNVNSDDDVNVVTAVAEIITSGWGGAGLDIGVIDHVSFNAAALQLKAENNFCSLSLSGGEPAKTIIAYLMDQIKGILFQNPSTGLLELRLNRNTSFSYSDERNFGSSDIIGLRQFSKGSWSSTINKYSGVFTDRSNQYAPNSVIVQNPDNSLANGRVDGSSYPYVMNVTLCLDIISRELASGAVPLFGLAFDAKRKASTILPGDVVFASFNEYKLYGVPITVKKVRDYPLTQNMLSIEGVQALIPESGVVYDPPGTPPNQGINFDPLAPDVTFAYTAPFWIAKRAGIASLSDKNVVTAIVMPIPKDDMQSGFDVYSSYKAATSNKIRYIANGLYPSYGNVVNAVSKYDGWTTGLIPSLVIDGVINPINLISVALAGVREGRILAFIDNEIISFESCALTGVRQWTLTNVKRGLLDTVAEDHAVGAAVLIIGNNYRNVINNSFEYPLSATPTLTVVSNVANVDGSLNNPASYKDFTSWVPSTPRTLAPVRPHDTKLNAVRNSVPFDVVTGSDVAVSWKTRTRTTTQIKFQADAAESSEYNFAGNRQYHTIVVVDANGVETEIVSTPDSADANSITATIPALASYGDCSIYVKAKIALFFGTLGSVYKDKLPVTIYPGEMFVSEDGASFFISEDGLSIYTQE